MERRLNPRSYLFIFSNSWEENSFSFDLFPAAEQCRFSLNIPFFSLTHMTLSIRNDVNYLTSRPPCLCLRALLCHDNSRENMTHAATLHRRQEQKQLIWLFRLLYPTESRNAKAFVTAIGWLLETGESADVSGWVSKQRYLFSPLHKRPSISQAF